MSAYNQPCNHNGRLLADTSPDNHIVGYSRTSANALINQSAVIPNPIGLRFGTSFDDQARVAPPPLGGSNIVPNDVAPLIGYAIAARTQYTQACWTWIKFLSDDTTALVGFPARRSHIQKLAETQLPGLETVYSTFKDALEQPGAQGLPREWNFSAIEGIGYYPLIDYYWFFRAIDRAQQGETLSSELQTAQQLTEQHLTCVRNGGEWSKCARSVDPSYDGLQGIPYDNTSSPGS